MLPCERILAGLRGRILRIQFCSWWRCNHARSEDGLYVLLLSNWGNIGMRAGIVVHRLREGRSVGG